LSCFKSSSGINGAPQVTRILSKEQRQVILYSRHRKKVLDYSQAGKKNFCLVEQFFLPLNRKNFCTEFRRMHVWYPEPVPIQEPCLLFEYQAARFDKQL